ncbi:MAG: DUF4892 domain-containing protein [Saprospiraceae bacterium]|nr:DUF4892 domain-containing protein [Saprospiraceae bacterium]
MKKQFSIVLLLASLAYPCLLHAQDKDVPNSSDHPLVSRFKDAFIRFYELKNFDTYALRLGPIQRGSEDAAKKQELEGKVTRIVYQAPSTASCLEIYRNYQQALQKAGFGSLFQCELDDCGNGFGYNYPNDNLPHIRTFTNQQRYLAMRRNDATGTQFVGIYTVQTHDGPVIRLDVVEAQAMKTEQVTVSPAQIKSDFEKTGKAVIEQIYFESGRAVLKPESKPALDAIAKFLKERGDLKVFVVGHTDSDGGFDFNQQLSQQRAQTVVNELTQKHGIAANRLSAKGVSYLCPVAANDTEAGKAKNRRVELVKQ